MFNDFHDRSSKSLALGRFFVLGSLTIPILHLNSGKYNISLELCFIKTLAVGLVMMIWDLAGMVF